LFDAGNLKINFVFREDTKIDVKRTITPLVSWYLAMEYCSEHPTMLGGSICKS